MGQSLQARLSNTTSEQAVESQLCRCVFLNQPPDVPMHTKSTRTKTSTLVAAEQSDCQLPAFVYPRTLAKESIELARELPADIRHLPLAHSLLKDANNGADVCQGFIGVHSLTLANLLEKVVQ